MYFCKILLSHVLHSPYLPGLPAVPLTLLLASWKPPWPVLFFFSSILEGCPVHFFSVPLCMLNALEILLYPSPDWHLLATRSLWCFGSFLQTMTFAIRRKCQEKPARTAELYLGVNQRHLNKGRRILPHWHEFECDWLILNTGTSQVIIGCAHLCNHAPK